MSKFTKVDSRKRRGSKTKARIKINDRPRLVVFRSSVHIYAQIVSRGEQGDLILASCSTVDKEVKPQVSGTKTEQAECVGKILAQRAKNKMIEKVAFDRSGYKYHGRIAALAKGAREEGLIF